jgi:energy-coupling factor transport system ATP-binding protein
VLDEPTIGIDPWAKPRIIKIIQEQKKVRTVIAITHDFELIKTADRILLLKEGRIKGDYLTFIDFYQDEFKNNKEN